ncbi:hypothetical protein [uncultured Aquimarina sp.]|nr:hypothetical protein [uncultured Aquimarina sp.]
MQYDYFRNGPKEGEEWQYYGIMIIIVFAVGLAFYLYDLYKNK